MHKMTDRATGNWLLAVQQKQIVNLPYPNSFSLVPNNKVNNTVVMAHGFCQYDPHRDCDNCMMLNFI